jgi:hypothetical protein
MTGPESGTPDLSAPTPRSPGRARTAPWLPAFHGITSDRGRSRPAHPAGRRKPGRPKLWHDRHPDMGTLTRAAASPPGRSPLSIAHREGRIKGAGHPHMPLPRTRTEALETLESVRPAATSPARIVREYTPSLGSIEHDRPDNGPREWPDPYASTETPACIANRRPPSEPLIARARPVKRSSRPTETRPAPLGSPEQERPHPRRPNTNTTRVDRTRPAQKPSPARGPAHARRSGSLARHPRPAPAVALPSPSADGRHRRRLPPSSTSSGPPHPNARHDQYPGVTTLPASDVRR